MLDEADAGGEISGQIVVVPTANPLGLAQYLHGDHLGRHDLQTGRNSNRNWPDLGNKLVQRVAGRLTDDEQSNAYVIRTTIQKLLDERPQATPVDSLYSILAREAYDSDLVIDLHCDDEGLMHLFVHPEIWPEVLDVAAEFGCRAAFSQLASGGATFAEAGIEPWLRLRAAYPGYPIPVGCQTITLELRGFADIEDNLAQTDAAALLNVLRRRRYLSGGAEAAPEPLCDLTGFDACDIIRTPQFGVVVYHTGLGERVKRGQPIGDIVNPWETPGSTRVTLYAATEGTIITRRLGSGLIASR